MHNPWVYRNLDNERSLKRLLSFLESSPTGAKLVHLAKKKAAQEGRTLGEIIEIGKVSLTDVTLVRTFSLKYPDQVRYRSKTKILIAKNAGLLHAILDLAHELVHFAKREQINPYQENFRLNSFVRETIEGRGGEVDAYLTECQVRRELLRHPKEQGGCRRNYNSKTKRFSRKKITQDFYRVGKHYQKLIKKLPDFHFLSQKGPLFISSARGVPYPVAALREYEFILKRVCQNDGRRRRLLGIQKELGHCP